MTKVASQEPQVVGKGSAGTTSLQTTAGNSTLEYCERELETILE